MLAPEITVEQQDAVREPAKKRRGRQLKKNNNADYNPVKVELQRQAISAEDEPLDEVEEFDKLLVDQQTMHCSDWEKS